MRQTFRLFCCILFLCPCLSTLTGNEIEDTEEYFRLDYSIAAMPVGEGHPDGILPFFHSADNGFVNVILRDPDFEQISDLLQSCVRVYTRDPRVEEVQPVFGEVVASESSLMFIPRFPLSSGVEYYIECAPFIASAETWRSKTYTENFYYTLQLPEENLEPTATVSAVYPSRSELPENLLKFYIHFSHPMSVGKVYDYIHLIDEEGKEVELPFLELGEELWDYDSQRLTLLFDPGRIKTGLVPNIQEGLALHAGRSYTLKIDGDWEDAQGQPMIDGFEKVFGVTTGDTVSPNPYNWKKTWPSAGTKEPIVLTFPESLDEALLQRVLIVQNKYTQIMNGTVKVSDHETRWEFTPSVNWQPGKYRLEIETILEDVAGNSIARPFELEKTESENYRAGPEVVHLNFEIQ